MTAKSLPGAITHDGGHAVPSVPAVGATGSGHAMPFGEIQKRLGRKQVSHQLIAEVPVAYVVFDVIYAGGELTLDKPLSERAHDPRSACLAVRTGSRRVRWSARKASCCSSAQIEEAAASGWVLRAPSLRADSVEQLEQYFDAGDGSRQRRADDQGPRSRRTCPDGAAAGG